MLTRKILLKAAQQLFVRRVTPGYAQDEYLVESPEGEARSRIEVRAERDQETGQLRFVLDTDPGKTMTRSS